MTEAHPGPLVYPHGMRKAIVPVMLVAVVLAGTSPAGAHRPVRTWSSFAVTVHLPAEVCGFRTEFHVRGRTTTKVFLNAAGEPVRMISTGPIRITFVRPGTDATASYAISGPSFFDARGRLVRGTGRWFVFTTEGRPAIAAGNLTFGGGGSPEGAGHLIDICAALA